MSEGVQTIDTASLNRIFGGFFFLLRHFGHLSFSDIFNDWKKRYDRIDFWK